MSNHESSEVDRLAAAFAALSNPQRLRMFIKLASSCCAPEPGARKLRRGTSFCCATEAGEGLDIAASTVSHHLKELRQAGLVHVERRGRRIECWASEDTLQRLASFFADWARPRRPAKGDVGRCEPAVVRRGETR
jgi:ArsR family transcriptional regulator